MKNKILAALFIAAFSLPVSAATGIKEITTIGTDYKNRGEDLDGKLCKNGGGINFVHCNDQKKAAESGGQYCFYTQPYTMKGYSVDTCSKWKAGEEARKKEQEAKEAAEKAAAADSETYYYANGIYAKNGKELCIAYAASVGKENHGVSSSGSSFTCGVSTTVGTRTTVHQELQSDTAIRVTLAGALAKYSGDNGGCTAYFSGENTISCLKDSSGVGGDSSGEESSDSESEKPKEEQEQEEDNPVVNMLANLYNMMKEEMTNLKNAVSNSSNGGNATADGNSTNNGTNTESANGTSDKGEKTGEEAESDGECKFLPDWMCGEMGSADDADFSGIKDAIPKKDAGNGYESENKGMSSSGSCPQPLSENIGGFNLEISFEPLCNFLDMIRGAVLALFAFAAAGIVLKAMDN
ncbi:hypothetical protein J2T38_002301 [Neisseria perflava]|uniref:virulence factor TspB C-terminal domain-related protein n=1 Tax=Neisseria perflava TaxID=33053 RepID=UPI0020A0803D|nr:virulence factor TspB C-terminal domain-related protein [Neisseria perflava]MCP1773447.1 hypothetical protein [Neisseria perflava]